MTIPTSKKLSAPQSPILIFDGYCNLCNGTVDFILRFDRYQQIRFVAMQTAEGKFLSQKLEIPKGEDTVMLWSKDGLLIRSAAAFSIALMLRFPFNLLSIFAILPVKFTDSIYRAIARSRIGLFGRRAMCRIELDSIHANRFPKIMELELEIATLELQV